jgi:hypothetical protein
MEHSIAWGGVDLVFNARRTLGPNSGAERTRVMRDSRYARISSGFRGLHHQHRGVAEGATYAAARLETQLRLRASRQALGAGEFAHPSQVLILAIRCSSRRVGASRLWLDGGAWHGATEKAPWIGMQSADGFSKEPTLPYMYQLNGTLYLHISLPRSFQS